MSVSEIIRKTRPDARHVYVVLGALLVGLIFWKPGFVLETVQFVVLGMIHVTPIVIPGIVLAA